MADKREPRKENWAESITWQSATGSEYEFQRIPHQALDHLRAINTPSSTNANLWNRDDVQEDENDETIEMLDTATTTEQPQKFHGKVVVVPMGARDLAGKDFYENLMNAVQDGLEKIEDYEMTSTKRKRRLKMNKHKFKKRRKEQESARRKLGK
ncbi:protein of unknown function [Taphrina deformans PYCC 5710]|uniref:Ribosomal protein mS38 C-terminal domain-containing protein n=1 Tax=Taphrina deformans (strain PYCC 5710 / ATCC 11124 / CBS 356.35 / IMI 108563 / JCM 9778 / NBRC 8474) TaxID=1097556 RepID=R4XCT2_TAPDE|nr:protein of unknown function [Taphrina deformans PYCC 5710]|eukprot:CCG82213.1 protein of unknown function [Taphrina deformans PYCC 5710]